MEVGALYIWIQSVATSDLPPAPFRLNYCTVIHDTERWLAKIQREARLPMGGARGKSGVLQREIRSIYDLIEGDNQW